MPSIVRDELAALGTEKLTAHLEARLAEAARAYERDRYYEAQAILREMARATPGVAAVRELCGLTLYRLGNWKAALRELRAFGDLTGSADQLPVVADCERALGRHARVTEIWSELRSAGAGSDVLAEGRLVMAGSLADRGRIDEAIALLAPAASRNVRGPHERHVRQWYLLADLYERSGDVPRAREFFQRVVRTDPELSDAAERLAGLR
ncbi:MAG: tetratricopeptide repeat protein [Acidimicrobiales bacterium]